MAKDITDLVDFGLNDDECLPLTRCVCGQVFKRWEFIISIYPDMADECPNCGRKLYFKVAIMIFEVEGR